MNKIKLHAYTSKSDAVYKKAELIRFMVCAPEIPLNQKITAEYKIQFNMDVTVMTGPITFGKEPVETSIVAEAPGFLDFRVEYKDSQAEAAAGVELLKIGPSTPCPEDFKEFWKRKKAQLKTVPINARMKRIASISKDAYREWNEKWPVFGNTPFVNEDIETFEIEADTSEGNPVRGYYSRPTGAKPKSLPAVLFTHGGGIGDSDFAKSCVCAKYEFLSMDINANGLLNEQPVKYYENIAKEIESKYGSYLYSKGRLDKETMYLGTMYLRHLRALDFLCAQPEWDRRTLIIRGASQGGALALACAGLDKRVSCICAGVPAFCDNTYKHPLDLFFLNDKDNEEKIEKTKNAVRYFSLKNFAPDIKAEAYFTVAFLDMSCHPATVYAGYNAYAGPKKIYNGPTAEHGGIPHSISYDDFTRFMMEHAGRHHTEKQ